MLYSVFFSFRDQIYLLSSVAFRSLGLVKDCLWLANLILNSVSVSPTYDSVFFFLVRLLSFSRVVTVAWYTMLCSLHSPFRGQLALFRQLQFFFASVLDFLSCALLCESMVFLMFGRQLYDNLRVLRLKIVLSMWSTGKLLSMIFRNARPTLVFTLRSNGGLYHVIFLDLFLLSLLFPVPVVCGLYSSLCVYPLLASAAWYSGIALLKMSSFDDISESRLFIPSGTALMTEGGWLLLVWMYSGVFPGLR